jgi:hypothetical protein
LLGGQFLQPDVCFRHCEGLQSCRFSNVYDRPLAERLRNHYLAVHSSDNGPRMTNPATTSLLDRANLDRDQVRHEVARGLLGADDGELFLEYSQTEALMFDNGRLKQATYDTSQGFGLRAVKDDAVGYAHSSDVSLPALIRAADAVAAAIQGALRRRRRTPMYGSMPTIIRWMRRASRPRSSYSPRSTPICATRIRACGRSASAWARPGR